MTSPVFIGSSTGFVDGNVGGWPEETHVFGFTNIDTHLDEITIDYEVSRVTVCIDSSNKPVE